MPNVPVPSNDNDLRPEIGIFWPALILILAVALPMVLWPAQAEKFIGGIYGTLSLKFGSLYMWFTVALCLICIFFACSRYGDVKLGPPEEKPQYSLKSWVAMIFCSGVAGACMFWAIVEPLWDVISLPQNAPAMSTEAFDWSLAYLLLHWGPNAWCTYFVAALPIAYLFHIRKKPVLRISAASEIVLGKQTNGVIGRACDVFFILGLLFCTAVTMCVSLPTVVAALNRVFGVTPGFTVELIVLLVSACIAGWSVWSGLDKGIKVLSDINVIIALAMVFFGFFAGPTSQLIDIFTNAIGKMLGNYMNMTFWIAPFADNSFPRDWTIFYALFWAGYGPFMGLFIARISRGRTIREVIIWGMLGCIAGGYLIHGVFGSYTLWLQYNAVHHVEGKAALDAVAILKESGGAAAMMAVLDTLPFGKIVMCVYCVFSTIFLATSVDSGCYVVASVATRRLGVNDDPARWHRSFWALAQALLAVGLLAIGGLNVAKQFGNFSGALMALPVLLLTWSWLKIVRYEKGYLLRHYMNPLPADSTDKWTAQEEETSPAPNTPEKSESR
ncbi:MAG: BCCT family transporter [Desulfovibrio sp.]|nr:BCCT family transporter [Desulfovibrio sp.]